MIVFLIIILVYSLIIYVSACLFEINILVIYCIILTVEFTSIYLYYSEFASISIHKTLFYCSRSHFGSSIYLE